VGILSIILSIDLNGLIDMTAICDRSVDLFQLVRMQDLGMVGITDMVLRKFLYVEVVVVLRSRGRMGWRRLPDGDRVLRIEWRMSGIGGFRRR
jgi:hypothetical protein